MGQLLKEALAQLGGRGGGSADLAQGGLPAGAAFEVVQVVLHRIAASLRTADPRS